MHARVHICIRGSTSRHIHEVYYFGLTVMENRGFNQGVDTHEIHTNIAGTASVNSISDTIATTMTSSSDSNNQSVAMVEIQRAVTTQVEFDEIYATQKVALGYKVKTKLFFQNCIHKNCSRKALAASVLSFFPFTKYMRSYKVPSWLLSDIVCGLTIGIMHLSQGTGHQKLNH